MEISEKFYKRWTNIYIDKGRKESWTAAKEWARNTLSPPQIKELTPHIEKALGVRK